MLCSRLLKKLERFHVASNIYSASNDEIKKIFATEIWRTCNEHTFSVLVIRIPFTVILVVYFFLPCVNTKIIRQFPHFKRGIYDYFNRVRLKCNFQKAIFHVCPCTRNHGLLAMIFRENVQETYPDTSAKSRNSGDGIPVVAINSNSCRETLFSPVRKKDEAYTFCIRATVRP